MTFLRKNNFEFEGDRKKNFVEIYKQVRYYMIDIQVKISYAKLIDVKLCHANVMWRDVLWRFMVVNLLFSLLCFV